MSTFRDYASDAPVYARLAANRARVHASNAWHRAVGRHVQGSRTRFWNWRSQKAFARGRRDVPARTGDQLRSRVPVYRDRVNPATGRQHRDDVRLGRSMDGALAAFKRSMPEVARTQRGRSR